jgi:DNA-binding Lrp family transcriptional regulator
MVHAVEREILVNMLDLTKLDADIVELLQTEHRIGLVEIARRTGYARGTIQARLQKLIEAGAIRDFGPRIEPRAIGFPVLAFVFLEISQGRLAEAVETLEAIPHVLEAYGTTGPRDLLCRVVARDNEHLQEIINAILHAPSVRRSTSYIAMSEQIAPRTAPLLRAAS